MRILRTTSSLVLLAGIAGAIIAAPAAAMAAEKMCPWALTLNCVAEKNGFQHPAWTNKCLAERQGIRILYPGACKWK
ncbi:MAG TPA: hypothetical protein VK430_04360 [Xanthobacteraceae bacterium]|nr:hypothetical protein [Xanthobacteraceae bacterium]